MPEPSELSTAVYESAGARSPFSPLTAAGTQTEVSARSRPFNDGLQTVRKGPLRCWSGGFHLPWRPNHHFHVSVRGGKETTYLVPSTPVVPPPVSSRSLAVRSKAVTATFMSISPANLVPTSSC